MLLWPEISALGVIFNFDNERMRPPKYPSDPPGGYISYNAFKAGWPGRYINVWRCGGLSMVLLQQKDPLELFVKSREFLPGSGFLSRRDMT